MLFSSVRHQRTTRLKDLPYGEAALVVRWHKRQFACKQRLCPGKASNRFDRRAAAVCADHRSDPAGCGGSGRVRQLRR